MSSHFKSELKQHRTLLKQKRAKFNYDIDLLRVNKPREFFKLLRKEPITIPTPDMDSFVDHFRSVFASDNLSSGDLHLFE